MQNSSRNVIAIERLQQGESLNKQYVKTNLFWEFSKFTSRDGESIESYYSRFYKIMNEIPRNQLEVATMQVNVQFLQQLQPKWSRFVTVFKQTIDLTKSSRHTSSTISHAPTKTKGKEVDKLRTPPSLSASEEDNLQTYQQQPQNLIKIQKQERSSTLRTENDRQTVQFGNQKIVIVAGARETVGNQVVQQIGIQCFNCKEYGHFAKECRKSKRVKDYSYHKEKMMLCKKEEKGVPLSAEQNDWL
ncbi:retrovirus-related pol polyprotein from transposon TNT 1-94 [Tanacetum coccineum]